MPDVKYRPAAQSAEKPSLGYAPAGIRDQIGRTRGNHYRLLSDAELQDFCHRAAAGDALATISLLLQGSDIATIL